MDNVTHGLWGIGIYGAWVTAQPHIVHNPLSTAVFVAAVLGSEAPDTDYVVKLTNGPAAYLKHHRGLSHSLPACFFWSLVIAGGLSIWQPGHFLLLFTVSLIGVVVHVLLDILTPYGTQALWPFTKHKFKLDVLFTIDPVFFILAGIGIVWSFHVDRPFVSAGWCLTGAAIYILLRTAYASWLSARLHEQFPGAHKLSVIPQLLPWWWAYVVETQASVESGSLTRKGPKRKELLWIRPTDDTVQIADWTMTNTSLGRLFVGFARHLIWQVRRDGAVEQVQLADATYRFGTWLPFSVSIAVLKGETGEWVIGSEVVRGQSIDYQAIATDLVNASPSSVRPKIPSENS